MMMSSLCPTLPTVCHVFPSVELSHLLLQGFRFHSRPGENTITYKKYYHGQWLIILEISLECSHKFHPSKTIPSQGCFGSKNIILCSYY